MKPITFLCLFTIGLFVSASPKLQEPKSMESFTYRIPHIAGPNWRTTIEVFNLGIQATEFELTKWNPDFTDLYTIPVHGSIVLTNSDFGTDGTAQITANVSLEVKLSYRFADSESLCEFFIPADHMSTTWMIPNSAKPWFQWFGRSQESGECCG